MLYSLEGEVRKSVGLSSLPIKTLECIAGDYLVCLDTGNGLQVSR